MLRMCVLDFFKGDFFEVWNKLTPHPHTKKNILICPIISKIF